MSEPRVVLGPLADEDSEILFQWINDRDLVLHNAPFRPVDAASHRDWYDAVRARHDVAIFAIRRASDHALIGTCQLHSIDPVHRSAELQIRIGDQAECGRGYGTEAVRMLLQHAFRDLGLNRVSLRVFANNDRAVRAYAKAGFTREGVLREAAYIDGRFVDVLAMAILSREYECDG